MYCTTQSISPIHWLLSQACNKAAPSPYLDKENSEEAYICNCNFPRLTTCDYLCWNNFYQTDYSQIFNTAENCKGFLINRLLLDPYVINECAVNQCESAIDEQQFTEFPNHSRTISDNCGSTPQLESGNSLYPTEFCPSSAHYKVAESSNSCDPHDRMVTQPLGNSQSSPRQKANKDSVASAQSSVNSRHRNRHKRNHKLDSSKDKKGDPHFRKRETTVSNNCQSSVHGIELREAGGNSNSKNQINQSNNSAPLNEVGNILESSLSNSQSHNEREPCDKREFQETEKDGSDTGYSSRCSTPPTPLLPNHKSAEEEKKVSDLKIESLQISTSNNLQIVQSRQSPSPSESSISSLGTDDPQKGGQKFPHCNAPNQGNHQQSFSKGYHTGRSNMHQVVYPNQKVQNNQIHKYNGNMKSLLFFNNHQNKEITEGIYRKYNNRNSHHSYRHFNPNFNRPSYPSQMLHNPNVGQNITSPYKRNNYGGNWNGGSYKNRHRWNPSQMTAGQNMQCNNTHWRHQQIPNNVKTQRNYEVKKLEDSSGTFFIGKKNHNASQLDYRSEATCQPPQLLVGSEWDALSLQVWNMFAINQQLDSTFRAKMKLKDCISKVIWNILPHCRLFVVGSSLSGFGANSSDVDMCLMVTQRDLDQRREAQAVLRLLQGELSNCGFVEKMDLIKAKVPILKFRDTFSSIDVDLNCNNSVGIRNTHLLNAYAQLDWRVRPLVLVVKLWAQHHHINNAKDMTISSYSLVLMVLHFLQCGVDPPVVPCLHKIFPEKFNFNNQIFKMEVTERMPPFSSKNKQTLGELFLGFLDYFANKFTFVENTISVRTGSILSSEDCSRVRTKKNDCRMWKYLCIEEPFDLTNTAKSVYDEIVFEKVKNVFKESHRQLNESKDLSTIFQKKSV